MLIKSCINCKFHEIRQQGEDKTSHCLRENCYARYSKCVATKALNWFLEKETSKNDRSFSAVDHLYPLELEAVFSASMADEGRALREFVSV